MPQISSHDIYLFNQGTMQQAWKSFGAHREGAGWRFTVWVPWVKSVSVTGSFNNWGETPMELLPDSGVWTAVIDDAREGDTYKYVITAENGEKIYKADPFAFAAQRRPGTASRLKDIGGYGWKDEAWLQLRQSESHFKRPMNIYEVHATSWRRKDPTVDNEEGFLTWYELADSLVPYVKDMGWNYIELLPVAEHPLDASWGYQVTGFYAPTSRCGDPVGLKYFIDRCHQAGIGVILDWVPGHFCRDAQGLGRFNGGMLYESADHQQWGTYRFDFARPQVRSFLMSNALYWLEEYHADGLRVDGVSSMLYLNFGNNEGTPARHNRYGGLEDVDAIEFLRQVNTAVGTVCPGCFTVAEESTAWPGVTKPPYEGGLGFHYKWNMGWMNDTLRYFSTAFEHRCFEHGKLNFSMMYAFSENFILPLSHDEVVHGKRSLIGRQPGDYWKQFAGMRTLLSYQMLHPGAKLTFMGSEIAPFIEWREYEELEWFMRDYLPHGQVQHYVRTLNNFYLKTPGLWKDNFSWGGFKWLEANNADQNVLLFTRSGGRKGGAEYVCVLNMSPCRRENYMVGVPYAGKWKEAINSDAIEFGGSGAVNPNSIDSRPMSIHGQANAISITLPPLGAAVFKCTKRAPVPKAPKAAKAAKAPVKGKKAAK